ncbi:hypothetical protein [Pseudomonas fluorescens]|uniref:hypothetical protein n=1 Tax=Pseudomonas fluorescens TaxID=294 RepID=UPI0012403D85|nr:hypothetical protein [Pseudomonas fluorescens]VVM73967.1 hypothetical protein PS676_01922 [Pseudomonas fluorescens]
MTWQAEFLEKASEAIRVYEEATAMIKKMVEDDVDVGPQWDAAVARQFSAFEDWSGLYREYADLLSGGESAGRCL